MQTFNEEKIAENYRLYKLQRTQRETEQKKLAEEAVAEKAKREAFYRSRPQLTREVETVTTRKIHLCAKCAAMIPAGSTVAVETSFWRDGNRNLLSETLHFCLGCRPVSTEAVANLCKFYYTCGNSQSYRCTHLAGLDCGSKKRRETESGAPQ